MAAIFLAGRYLIFKPLDKLTDGEKAAMRTCVKSDILTFSVAAPMFERMVGNMDKSFLTTYIWKPLVNRSASMGIDDGLFVYLCPTKNLNQ